MRIRSTRPHFWRSERIASVDWDARFVLKGLESYVDDNGVGKDDIALIVGDLFQRDMIREPSRTVARVSEAISDLSQAGLLWRYTVDGTHLLYIAFWEEVQRIDKAQDGRHPRPDGTLNYKDSAIRESVASPREDSRTFAPVVEEEGSSGVGKEPPYPPDDEPSPNRAPMKPTGSEKALARFEGIPGQPSALARQVAIAYSESGPVPIQPKLLREVAGQIDTLLQAAIPPEAIARGLDAWTASNAFSPTQIPNYVHKANNGHTVSNGVSKPTISALDHQAAGEALLAKVSTK